METFLIRSYRYRKIPILKQLETQQWHLQEDPGLQDLASNVKFEISDIINDSLVGIESTKCMIDIDTMQTTIKGWLSPDGRFCHEVCVDRLGKVYFSANHESDQPHLYLNAMGPPLAANQNAVQLSELKKAYQQPFAIQSTPAMVRYSDAQGPGVFCNLTDSRLRFKTAYDFWDFMIASKFFDIVKWQDFDAITVMKGLSTELSTSIKKFAANIKNYFDVPDSKEKESIKTVLREYIHLDFIRIRYFLRNVLLGPLANQISQYKMIEGEFDDGEKAVLRVTVTFLESIQKLELITDQNIREWFGDLDKISPKIYGIIVYKTLKANNNFRRCLEGNSAKINRLKQLKQNQKQAEANKEGFYPWVDDVREMWRLSTFLRSLTSNKQISFKLQCESN